MSIGDLQVAPAGPRVAYRPILSFDQRRMRMRSWRCQRVLRAGRWVLNLLNLLEQGSGRSFDPETSFASLPYAPDVFPAARVCAKASDLAASPPVPRPRLPLDRLRQSSTVCTAV